MPREVVHVYDGQTDKHLPPPPAPEPPVHPDTEAFWKHQEEVYAAEQEKMKRIAVEEDMRLKKIRDTMNERPCYGEFVDSSDVQTDPPIKPGQIMYISNPSELNSLIKGRPGKITVYDPADDPPLSKIDWSAVPWAALEEVARTLAIGKAKHPGKDDYLVGTHTYQDLASGLLRHYAAWAKGENIDPDGFHHLAGVAARALMLVELHLRRRMDLDDRK